LELLTVSRIEKVISTFGRERGRRYLCEYVNRSQDGIKLAVDQEFWQFAGKLYTESSEENYPYPYPELEIDWDEAFDRLTWDEYWDELLKEDLEKVSG